MNAYPLPRARARGVRLEPMVGVLLILLVVFVAGVQIGIRHGRALERQESATQEGQR